MKEKSYQLLSLPIVRSWFQEVPTEQSSCGELPMGARYVPSEGIKGKCSLTDGTAAWVFEYTGEMKAVLTASSRMLLATSEPPSGRVQLWDVLAGSPIRTLKAPCWAGGEVVFSMAFTPDGEWLAGSVLSRQFPLLGCVALWKIRDDFVKSLPLPSPPSNSFGFVGPLAFSPQGGFLAVETPYSVILWEIKEGIIKEWPRFFTHTSIAHTLTFSPDGTLLALCDSDGLVTIWEVPSGEEVSFFIAAGCPLAFAPSGQLLASGSVKQEQESPEAITQIWKLNRP